MDPMTLIGSVKCVSAGVGVLGSTPPSRQHMQMFRIRENVPNEPS